MAGMFHSLKEAAEKLKIKEKEVKELIEQGKLREFRIGSDLLLKAEEVQALAAEKGISIEPEAPAEEEPTFIHPEAETPEPETPEAGTPEFEAEDVEIPEVELPDSGTAEPVFNMSDLENLDIEEETLPPQAGEPKAKTKKFAAFQPKATSKPRFSTKREAARTISLPRLSIWQWLLTGLRKDNPLAVIVFLLLFGIIIIAVLIGIVSIVHKIL